MRAFILSLSIVLLIAACKDNPAGPDKSYPFTVGAWEVTSPKHAHFVGIGMSKAKTSNSTQSAHVDTLIIEQPGDLSLDIRQDTASGLHGVQLIFKDYSPHIDSIRAGATTINIDSTITHGAPGAARRVYEEEDHLRYEVDLFYQCTAEFKDDNLFVETYTEDLELFKVYDFKTSGLQQAFKEVTYACD